MRKRMCLLILVIALQITMMQRITDTAKHSAAYENRTNDGLVASTRTAGQFSRYIVGALCVNIVVFSICWKVSKDSNAFFIFPRMFEYIMFLFQHVSLSSSWLASISDDFRCARHDFLRDNCRSMCTNYKRNVYIFGLHLYLPILYLERHELKTSNEETEQFYVQQISLWNGINCAFFSSLQRKNNHLHSVTILSSQPYFLMLIIQKIANQALFSTKRRKKAHRIKNCQTRCIAIYGTVVQVECPK